ncbi:hypothetical protein J1N35_037693 [Gossypium stocksii]|uniref:Uncharacterized protein n=1 Tax=Gossypium stocksii TaxID=47602 RepID=A0A9D3ZLX5_9ROSI|nr:hypothetical protein J1N35_037693 [Gossypium stocksii]
MNREVKGSSRKGSSKKSGRYSAEKKEPVALSNDRPTKERKVVERYSAPSVARFNETFNGVLLAYDVNILDKQVVAERKHVHETGLLDEVEVVIVSPMTREGIYRVLDQPWCNRGFNLFKLEKPRLSTSSCGMLFNVAFHGRSS